MKELSELLKVLEINKDISNVSVRDVRNAFKKLALLLHPDKAGEEKTEAFQNSGLPMTNSKSTLRINVKQRTWTKQIMMKRGFSMTIFSNSIFHLKTLEVLRLELRMI